MTPLVPSRLRATLALFLSMAALAGCRGEGPGHQVPVTVEVRVAPTPPLAGPARVVLSVADSVGSPLEGAEVRVEATMDHAGMVPVHATARDEGGGNYLIPDLEFTMAGDWILFVRVGLPDGRTAVREHRLRVVSPPTRDPGP